MKYVIKQICSIVKSPAWWLGVMLSSLAMFMGIAGEELVDLNLGYLISASMDFGVFIPLAPLATTLSINKFLENSMRDSCRNTNLLRTGKTLYVLKTAISAAIAGGLALAFGWLIFVAMVLIIWNVPLTGMELAGLNLDGIGTLLKTTDTVWVYYIIRFLLVFVFGVFCSFCAVPVAVLRADAATICLVPFVLLRIAQYYLFTVVPSFVSPTMVLLGRLQDFGSPFADVLMSVVGMLVLGTFLTVIALVLFRWRYKHE